MRLRDARRFARALTIVAGCLLAIAAGFACLRYSFAEPLTRTSYDLPFIWRPTLDTHEIVLVYLDEESAKQLHQPIDDIWNRSLHVPLLDRLARDGARLAFYDIVFDTASADPAGDTALAAALQNFGKAILGGALEIAAIEDELVGAETFFSAEEDGVMGFEFFGHVVGVEDGDFGGFGQTGCAHHGDVDVGDDEDGGAAVGGGADVGPASAASAGVPAGRLGASGRGAP